MTPLEPPLALLAELAHRCPLRCPYCSNPLTLERASAELDTASWQRVFSEAAAMGVLQGVSRVASRSSAATSLSSSDMPPKSGSTAI